MKNIKTLMMSFSILLTGCGMTDPWEEYANEGNFPDRLLPSDLKATLCSSDAWKMAYQNTDFYFSFYEDGTVTCNSNMFEDETSTEYIFDWDNPESVMLRIVGGGHLSYLPSDYAEDTFVVTSFSGDRIAATTETNGIEVEMTPVTTEDITNLNESKWEIRSILCAADGWKLEYEGYRFYYEFNSDGKVKCNSNMLKAAEELTYGFSGSISSPVLTIDKGGHIAYLPEELHESSFAIGTHNSSEIDAEGIATERQVKFVAVSDADIAAVEEEKGAIFKIIEIGMNNGVIRSSDDKFLAHYAIDVNTGHSIRFDILENRVLSHVSSEITIDKDANVSISAPVTIGGYQVGTISFDVEAKTATLNTSSLKVTSQDGIVDWFINDFRTYLIRPSSQENRGDMSDNLMKELNDNTYYWDKIEVSDRSNRPLVFTPKGGNFEGRTWSCFYSANSNPLDGVRTDEIGKVRFNRPYTVKNINGGAISTDHISEIERLYPEILDAYYHEDGLYLILEGVKNEDNSQLYLISPTTGNWFKCDRDL